MEKPKYERILVKLGGEALLGDRHYGIDIEATKEVANQIKQVHELGVQIALTIGAGNIFRGLSGEKRGLDRATADYMGMVATVINALALQDALEKIGVDTRVQTAIEMKSVAEPYIRRRAIRHMEKGRVVILAAGVGSPYFTTDSGAALRALELKCEILLKATKVDGVYDKDPLKYKDAKRFKTLKYIDAIKEEGIQIMDTAALSLCMENKLPIVVFNLRRTENLKKVVLGEDIGTRVET
ncbi:MAG: UMP kinase [Candidatus Chisholmbacteria bacterium RIFCSPLOWO2_01_FULL_50_28]|uniref:Uridylate kinase n=1 Tax=Candidatus Chisholmbacteria bacterium RIFCSPHIGHO2_01_FULL_52_32 TaxID=1797591 RepID=A0A1G1VUK6_9BACT|nr:MAG: UMP kinase [Candidatus Chisholmbacteria bacterium RIFCSPHIGHO2_01_FULL_52_32]OGY19686.1 MAG: UMP kinase [Candidatus Chisholmbacteria bacterium RIFCSPLOWO2_01_FULL_50_28]